MKSSDEARPALRSGPSTQHRRGRLRVLVAEDDADDRFLILRALREHTRFGAACAVNDGVELLDYLSRRGAYCDPAASPRPGLILLDLNMPRKNGLEALQEIKSDPALRRIPTVVLTTSMLEEDIARSYDIGANAYVVKPMHFSDLRRITRCFDNFWAGTARLPSLN